MFTYLVPGADFLSCFAFTRCLTELFMDLFQFGQVQITKDKLDVECVDSLLEPDHHILNSPLAEDANTYCVSKTFLITHINYLVMTCILRPEILIFGKTGCRQRLRFLVLF